MKNIKQWPLLATAAAMIIVATSPSSIEWMRIAAIVVCVLVLVIFARANIKKN